jgi:hypothetical protein
MSSGYIQKNARRGDGAGNNGKSHSSTRLLQVGGATQMGDESRNDTIHDDSRFRAPAHLTTIYSPNANELR